MPSAAPQALSLVTFFRPVKKVTRLPAGAGDLDLHVSIFAVLGLHLSQGSGRDLWPGIRAFSRYEKGETRQGKALDKLLRLLDRHPDLLDEIRVKVAA